MRLSGGYASNLKLLLRSILTSALLITSSFSLAPSAMAAACTPETTTSGNYTIVAFKTVGTCTWTSPAGTNVIRGLIVAGGGGGGGHMGGGGGGGGYVEFESLTVTNDVLTIVVGDGGAGALGTGTVAAPSGDNSTITGNGVSLIARGGAGGASVYSPGTPAQSNGGSGGGASGYSGTSGSRSVGTQTSQIQSPSLSSIGGFQYGGDGAAGGVAWNPGGGGGAGGNGSNTPANGGIGIQNSILGTSYYWSGGGGGSGWSSAGGNGGNGGGGGGGYNTGSGGSGGAGLNTGTTGAYNGGAGGTNTGGGGGAGTYSGYNGAKGGSGIVVLRYLTFASPTVFTSSAAPYANTSSAITFSITFSQNVDQVAAGDFSNAGTATGCTFSINAVTGTSFTLTASGCSEGTLIPQILAGSVLGTVSGLYGPTSNALTTTPVTIDRTAPTNSSVSAPANKTYIPTETPTFTMVFSESVTVTGTPRIALTVGSLAKYATFVSMTDSKTALFRYTVTKTTGEFDTDGIAIASTTLDLNGGSIADLATNALSPATFTAPTLTSVLVAQPVSAPTITSITPGNAQLTVNFTEGSANGSAITNYKYSLNGAAFTAASPVDTATPLVITGLTNGTAYSVRILAINAAGDGDSSTAISATPSTVVVAGGSNISRVYGTTSTTTAFTASGGTAPYVFSLSGGTAGISIDTSTGVVTASNTLAVGTYTPSVVATDSNGTPRIGSLGMSIVIMQDTPTATIALPNSATNAALGGAVTITATVSKDGVLVFKVDGSTISGCSAVSSSAGTATCSWTPGALGGVVLTAVLTPTDSTNYRSVTTIGLSITVVNGVSTVSLSLTGGVTQAPKGQAINIIAAISQSGKVSFFADGKRIAGCFNMSATAGNKSCSWKPTVQKQVNLTATLNPTNNVYNSSTSTLTVWVIRRSGTR